MPKNNRPLVFNGYIGFKARLEERQALEVLAQRERQSLSETIRQLILREAQRDLLAIEADADAD